MSVLDELEFIFFHLMPYAPLPDGYQQLDSLWVDYPNSNFDPATRSRAVQALLERTAAGRQAWATTACSSTSTTTRSSP